MIYFIILIEKKNTYFVGLNVSPVVFDENVFEKDALQLNISWKSADLGGELKRKQHIIFGLNVDYGLCDGQWTVNPRRKLALVGNFTFSTKLYFVIQIRWEAYMENSNKKEL